MSRVGIKPTKDQPPLDVQCRVRGLQTWTPQSHLVGLNFLGSSFTLDATYFSCCAAQGFESVLAPTPEGHGTYRSCGLVERMVHLGELCALFLKQNSGESPAKALGVSSKDSKSNVEFIVKAVERWRSLHAGAMVSAEKGRLVTDVLTLPNGISDTWPAVASLVWHDGLNVLVHRHGRGVPPVAAWVSRIQKPTASGKRFVIVLESVQKLWEASYLDEFEQVVSFASQVGLPLWLFLAPDDARDSAPEVKSLKFQSNLSQKVGRFRRGSIEKWLSPGTTARLVEVCELPRLKAKP